MDQPPQPPPIEQVASRSLGAPVRIPRWHLHRRLYEWVIGLAERRHSTTWLFALSFSESSFFPVPPDVLLIPLVMGSRRKAFHFATWCTVASVLGGLFGYLIGWGPLRFIGVWLADQYGFTEQLEHVLLKIEQYGFWFVFVAGLTPIPYKVFTIAGGMSRMNVVLFVVASLVGRGLRFYGVSALLYLFGQPIKRWIDRYFNWACIVFTIVLIGGFYAVKHQSWIVELFRSLF